MRKISSLAVALTTILAASSGCATTPPPPYKSTYHRITRTESIAQPTGQLKPQLSALKTRAEDGDAKAAAAIYAGLGACSTDSLADQISFNASCTGITKEDMDSRGYWMSLAAILGDKTAQYNYAAGGIGNIFISPMDAIKNPDGVKKYREQAKIYLTDLSQQCHVDAIATIVRDASDDGLIYGSNPELAYKFLVVLNTLRTNPDLQAEHVLEAKVDPQHILSLRADAASFIDNHCK